jgi:L-malate glycosyltransferase
LQSVKALKIAILGDANSINVQRWQQGLTNAGADVHLFSIHIERSQQEKVYPVPAVRIPGLPEKLRYFFAIPSARKMTRELKPDLLIGYFVTGYGTVSAFTGFHPLVQITSGEDILTSPFNPLLRPLIKYNLNHADLIVAWAPHMAAAAQALNISDEKLFTLPRGIPLERYEGKRTRRPERGDAIRLISTRSLYPIYNINVEIHAIKLLRDRGVNCSLTIVGGGPLRDNLASLVHELELEQNIQFVGIVSNDDLPDLLIQHNLYIALPVIDGVSASLLEAMATGLFPIVYNNPANQYWIHSGQNGLLVDSLEAEHVAGVIEQAINDLDLRHYAWTVNPPIIFERGDLQRNTAAYLDRFSQLVSKYYNQRIMQQ